MVGFTIWYQPANTGRAITGLEMHLLQIKLSIIIITWYKAFSLKFFLQWQNKAHETYCHHQG